MTSAAGYSGTPRAKKLGIAAGLRVVAIDPPGDHRAVVSPSVDVKVCAVDAVGSGLKLVVRREWCAGPCRR